MRNKEIIILIGISGSGKSTWSSNFLQDNNSYVRINRDDVRKTMIGDLKYYYSRLNLKLLEDTVTHLEFKFYELYNSKGFDIIIDNTNLQKKYIQNWLDLAKNENYDVKFKLFDCDLKDAKNRIIHRDFYERYKDQLTLDTYNDDYIKNLTSTFPEVDYIERQYQQYRSIKLWIEEHYKDKII